MANYKLSNTAKEDLIRIHHYGVERLECSKQILILIPFLIISK